jgi:hypothetical protein
VKLLFTIKPKYLCSVALSYMLYVKHQELLVVHNTANKDIILFWSKNNYLKKVFAIICRVIISLMWNNFVKHESIVSTLYMCIVLYWRFVANIYDLLPIVILVTADKIRNSLNTSYINVIMWQIVLNNYIKACDFTLWVSIVSC